MPLKHNKSKKIASYYQKSFNDLIKEMYLAKKMSSIEITEEFFKTTKIKISPRYIQLKIKDLNIISRSYSERRILAIKKGRMDYTPYKKLVKSSDLRKGINPKLRYQIFKRDNYNCVLCGKTAKEDLLVIDHIKPVTSGGNNSPDNLRVLCRECNQGKMLLEERF